jgi:hypothetical protein
MKKLTLIIATTLLAGTFAHAGPFNTQALKQPVLQQKLAMPSPGKPNLVVDSIGWRDEICHSPCNQQLKRDLHINKPCSPLTVTVRNTGQSRAGNFTLRVNYLNWHSNAANRQVTVNGLNAGESKTIVFSGSLDIGYYNADANFLARVDSTSSVSESNETDNTRTSRFN